MTLRARLTITSGALLAIIFVAVGLGAQMVMQGRFADQSRLTLLSTAQYIRNNFTLNLPAKVPALPQPAGSMLKNPGGIYEIANANGQPISVAGISKSAALHVGNGVLQSVISRRHSFFRTVTWAGNSVEVYFTPIFYTPPGNCSITHPLCQSHRRADAVLIVGKSQSDIRGALDVFRVSVFGGEAILWIIVVGIIWLVTSSVLRPIRAITEREALIAETRDFSARVPVEKSPAELQRLARTFNAMLASLEDAYANQRRFLADASHELRTPLTVVQGNLHYLETAHDGPVTEREEALHAARLEADRMGMLVADLLALSRADAGYSIEREPVELDRVVVDAYRTMKSRERNLSGRESVHIHLGRLDEFVVSGDYYRLLQLVLILLDNAVRYTPQTGQVTVELAAIDDTTATVCVSDTGSGVPLEERERIFERFYRSKHARSRAEGSGLGLPIARWIAEAHGGEITIRDAPTGGSIFVVTLPGEAKVPVATFPSAETPEDLVTRGSVSDWS